MFDMKKVEMVLVFFILFWPPIAVFASVMLDYAAVSNKTIIAVSTVSVIIWIVFIVGWIMI